MNGRPFDENFSLIEYLEPELMIQVIAYLDGKSKRALRAVNNKQRELIRTSQPTPYYSKKEFTLGVSGVLFDSNAHFAHFDMTPDVYIYDKAYLEKAWYVYSSTVFSTSLKPAIIYKLKDGDKFDEEDGVFDHFAEGEDLGETGRLYSPHLLHTWPVNHIWVLAQTHIARPFSVYAEIKLENIMCRKDTEVFSAFTKEIATAVKAGYTLSVNYDDNRIWLYPSDDTNMQELSVKEIELLPEDIVKAVAEAKKAQDVRDKNQPVHSAVSALMDLYITMDIASVEQLEDFRSILKVVIADILVDMYADSTDKKYTFQLFIEKFNGYFDEDKITLTRTSKTRLFDVDNVLRNIRKDVISVLSNHLEDCIEDRLNVVKKPSIRNYD